jgi:hypothetical protein
VKLAPRGEDPLFTHPFFAREENVQPLRGERRGFCSPLGDNFFPRSQRLPWGPNFPLGVNSICKNLLQETGTIKKTKLRLPPWILVNIHKILQAEQVQRAITYKHALSSLKNIDSMIYKISVVIFNSHS